MCLLNKKALEVFEMKRLMALILAAVVVTTAAELPRAETPLAPHNPDPLLPAMESLP